MNLLQTIEQLQQDKEERKVFPTHVTFNELYVEVKNQLMTELNQLVKEKKITFNHTLNDKSFSITKTKTP